MNNTKSNVKLKETLNSIHQSISYLLIFKYPFNPQNIEFFEKIWSFDKIGKRDILTFVLLKGTCNCITLWRCIECEAMSFDDKAQCYFKLTLLDNSSVLLM